MTKSIVRILASISVLALATTSASSKDLQEIRFSPLNPASKDLESFSLILTNADQDVTASISNIRGLSSSEINLKYRCSLGLNVCRFVAESDVKFGIMVRLLDQKLRDYQAGQISFCEIDLVMTFAAYYELHRVEWGDFLSKGIVNSNSDNFVPDFTGIETWKRISEGC